MGKSVETGSRPMVMSPFSGMSWPAAGPPVIRKVIGFAAACIGAAVKPCWVAWLCATGLAAGAVGISTSRALAAVGAAVKTPVLTAPDAAVDLIRAAIGG